MWKSEWFQLFAMEIDCLSSEIGGLASVGVFPVEGDPVGGDPSPQSRCRRPVDWMGLLIVL